MSSSPNHPPGHSTQYLAGWNRFEGIVTFGTHFTNYRITLQDRVLVIPLGDILRPVSGILEEGFWQSLCSECRNSIDPDFSVGSLERLPCVVTLTPLSFLTISTGGSQPGLSIACSCPDAPHFVGRPSTLRPNKRTTIKLVLI